MSIELSDLMIAYKKLKQEVYYDNTNLVLRKRMAIFESGDSFSLFRRAFMTFLNRKMVKTNEPILIHRLKSLYENLINNNLTYFDELFRDIRIFLLPKSFMKNNDINETENNEETNNNITYNIKNTNNYKIKKEVYFIDAPIEIHILNVLWILKIGFKLEKDFNDCVYGNRLLLTTSKNIKYDGPLFIPYIKQYQKWRDNCINKAKDLHEKGNSISIVNLDIKDCYHSIRLDLNDLHVNILKYDEKDKVLNTLVQIFIKTHEVYQYKFNTDFKPHIVNDKKIFLPIGLMSSSILCNWYLKDFDQDLIENIKPIYYGRYVDDLSLVITDYIKDNINLQNYINERFDKIFEDDPNNKGLIKIKKNNLFLQTEKIQVFYFDRYGPSTVINKFKEELLKSSSEFRSLPDNKNEEIDSDNAMYEFIFDDSKGKLKTLKDFKETRYGLSIYLAKKIEYYKNNPGKDSLKEAKLLTSFFIGMNIIFIINYGKNYLHFL